MRRDVTEKRDQFFTVKELATIYRVGIDTMYRILRRREIKKFRVGRTYLVSLESLKEFEERGGAFASGGPRKGRKPR